VTEAEEFKLRLALAPYAFDGTEAVQAIITLVNSHSRPPDLRTAVRKILTRQYGDSVPIDAVIAYYDNHRGE
jgi:hypothetical protein